MKCLYLIVALVLCSPAWATTFTAASCGEADFNTAIASASNGDTVKGPVAGGSATWSSVMTGGTLSKGITLDGNGCVITFASSGADIDVTAIATFPFVLKNFTFNGATGNNNGQVIFRGLTSSTALCEITNNTFQNGDGELQTQGHGACLITGNTFSSSVASSQSIEFWGASGAGDYSPRKDDIIPGSPNMPYFENNTVANTNGTTYGMIQMYFGGVAVIRDNHLFNVGFETHGSSPGTCAGENGARWFEFYNNDHHPTPGITLPIKFRGGSGIVFGNTTTIADKLIITEDCTSGTWPIQAQVGQGINPTASSGTTTASCCWSPLYVWNDSTAFATEIDNATFIQVGTTALSCTHAGSECDAVITTNQLATQLRCESAADQTTGCPVSYTYAPYQYPYLGGSPQAALPTFSPGAGTYVGSQSVTITSASGGAIICYNTTGSPATNGSTGCTTGTLYSGPVTVSVNSTLFAVAGGTGFTDSGVANASYNFVIPPQNGSGSGFTAISH